MGIQMIVDLPPGLLLGNQSAFRQDADMFGNRLSAAVEMFCQCIGRHSLYNEQVEYCPSCRVGDSLKNVPSGYQCHNVQLYNCKYNAQLYSCKFFLGEGGGK